jgi:DNA-directed RNA polymerase subunit RPC12/RpoP
MKTTRMPEYRCLDCGAVHDAATNFAGETPSSGSVSICAECGAIALFDDFLQLRRPTPAERASIERATGFADYREQAHQFRRKRPVRSTS